MDRHRRVRGSYRAGAASSHLAATPTASSQSLSAPAPAFADTPKKDRDVFDYDGQKAAKDVKKIVFVANYSEHAQRGFRQALTLAESEKSERLSVKGI